jgi:hypothetical protein
MIRRVVALAAAMSAIGGVALAQTGAADVRDRGTAEFACGDNGTISWGPTVLFPPNHKERDILVTYTDSDEPANTVTLNVTTNLHNEVVDGDEINGTGNTPFLTDSTGATGEDTDGSVTVVPKAVAERSGHKNSQGGRVYEFDYEATSDDGDGCSSDPATAGDGILICVPHDMRGGGNCSTEQLPPTQNTAPPNIPAPALPSASGGGGATGGVDQAVEEVTTGLNGLLGG